VPVGRLDEIRKRLTYGNVVATLALFVALGGASYATVALPSNSVGTRQLAFPLGLKSSTGPGTSTSVQVCGAGIPCPPPPLTTLATVRVSLKRSSRLLVVGLAEEDSSHKSRATTQLEMGVEFDRGANMEQFQARLAPETVSFSRIVSARAGRHTISLVADAQSDSGPAHKVEFFHPQITVIGLPPLR